MRKALFLDRDGVINIEKHYLHKIEDFEFIPGIVEVMRQYQQEGYALVVVTNQSGIGRGYYTEEDFWQLTEWMKQTLAEQGIVIEGVYFSPYHPEKGVGEYRRESDCRKPGPGMLLKAAEEMELDLGASMLLGDKESDVEAGQNAGLAQTIRLLEKGKTREDSKADVVIYDVRELLKSR
ncbi:MAG: D-glycero-beta-D-manno-heptose 1,7-bisphosphate 7-phosphatase [Anaeromusa sp.]|uniref:D-glycero-beta-D-manno-heptose 1,7-bisphosphate 7-phosphatase n=1 Tax=Anaeromusa sp. TaxID=1872520 RepID=UPI002B2134D0|nr:D-glycero-beta-D-manno-heptose 1,7-bisphosphate 7-phosphatase [Anaeromusa sp.]MEA4835972.1 D-glycero-beta-D-manno-heptose 1,7-bisphosphate 7-phosphatase [Anaeromusa sp.]